MQKNRVIIWTAIGATLLLAAGAATLPTPSTWPPDYVGFHEQLIVNIIMATTHTAGAVLFLTNLDVYKAKLRRAYIVLSIGTLATGLGTLQMTVITLLNGWETPYGKSGATMLPFILSGLLLYLGVRSFARLAGVQHILTKARVVLPAVAVIVGLSTLLPHVNNPRITDAANDVLVGISVWSGVLILAAALLAQHLQRHTGALYHNAVKWLVRALYAGGAVLLYQAAYTLAINGYDVVFNTASSCLIVLSGLVWVRAGYAFALTKYYSEDVPLLKMLVSRSTTLVDRPETVVDMVTYAAGLVSNSADIDPLLDKVRAVTATLGPNDKLSADNSRLLIQTYLQIEEYLTTKEAVRNYTRQELRAHLAPALSKLVAAQESHTAK